MDGLRGRPCPHGFPLGNDALNMTFGGGTAQSGAGGNGTDAQFFALQLH
jgi:hypothetical protein